MAVFLKDTLCVPRKLPYQQKLIAGILALLKEKIINNFPHCIPKRTKVLCNYSSHRNTEQKALL